MGNFSDVISNIGQIEVLDDTVYSEKKPRKDGGTWDFRYQFVEFTTMGTRGLIRGECVLQLPRNVDQYSKGLYLPSCRSYQVESRFDPPQLSFARDIRLTPFPEDVYRLYEADLKRAA